MRITQTKKMKRRKENNNNNRRIKVFLKKFNKDSKKDVFLKSEMSIEELDLPGNKKYLILSKVMMIIKKRSKPKNLKKTI